MITLTGLWSKKSKDGKTYYTSNVTVEALEKAIAEVKENGGRIMVFKNENKKTDKHPDLNLCVSGNEFKSDKSKESVMQTATELFGDMTF